MFCFTLLFFSLRGMQKASKKRLLKALWHPVQTPYEDPLYLVSGPSMDDGLDEDAQVLSGLSGLVALEADPQAGRTRFVERDLVHQLFPAVLQHQTADLFTFLKDRKKKT